MDPESRARAYLEAFEARDMERCLDFFAEDAVIAFQSGVYRGRTQIEEWHRDRFSADLRLLRLNGIAVRGDTVVVDGVATSKRLRAWRIDSVHGAITIVFGGEQIKEATFGVRMGSG
jgi:ketosteroid isomerase-like protein